MTERLGPYILGPTDNENQGVYAGDARELAKVIPDSSIDFILWDPDYGVEMDYGLETPMAGSQSIEFLCELLSTLRPKSKTGQAIIFWSGSLERIKSLLDSNTSRIWPIHYMGIWYKPNGAGPTGNGFGRRFETWFWLKDGSKPRSEWSRLPDVLQVNRVVPGHREAVGHPSQKPIALLEKLIRFFTVPNDIVFDPTIGSGSTGVAAKRLSRKFLGFEANQDYVSMARQRIQQTQLPLFTLEPQQAPMLI